MSAYVVSKAHIDYLLSAGMSHSLLDSHSPLRWFDADPDEESYERGVAIPPGSLAWYHAHVRELNKHTAGQVGAMLLAENQRSVDYRYDESEIEEPYLFAEVMGPFDPVDVLMAARGYTYQACEHPEWERSEARRFIDALKDLAISRLTVESEFWGVDESMVQYKPGISVLGLGRG